MEYVSVLGWTKIILLRLIKANLKKKELSMKHVSDKKTHSPLCQIYRPGVICKKVPKKWISTQAPSGKSTRILIF